MGIFLQLNPQADDIMYISNISVTDYGTVNSFRLFKPNGIIPANLERTINIFF